VAGPVLLVVVGMGHKGVWGEESFALSALDAPGLGLGVGLGQHQAFAVPETVMLNPEGKGRGLGVAKADGGPGWVALQQEAAQPLNIRLGDQAALVGRLGKDLGIFEHLELVRGAGGAVDLELLACLVDVCQTEPLQDTVEDLGKAEPGLAAHLEARDPLTSDNSFL